MGREEILTFLDERKSEPMLEIGPLIYPFLTKDRYDNICYADIKSKDEIYEEYKTYPDVGPVEQLYDKIVPIDYVVTETYKKAVGDNVFSVVFSSHVLEHCWDIIGHFKELCDILTEDGYIVMFIPDKRYCFDCFREVTSFRDAFDIHISCDIKRTARLVFDCFFQSTNHNDTEKYWGREVSLTDRVQDGGDYLHALEMYRQVNNEGLMVNTHIWTFTYISFLEFFRDCLRAKMLPFTLHYSEPTKPGSFEFAIILQKNLSVLSDDSKRRAEIERITELIEKDADEARATIRDIYAELQIQRSEAQIQRSEAQRQKSEVERLQAEISGAKSYEKEYLDVLNSNSWKITKPLRAIKRAISGVGDAPSAELKHPVIPPE